MAQFLDSNIEQVKPTYLANAAAGREPFLDDLEPLAQLPARGGEKGI
jgi:hypothetical protein